MQKEKWFEVCAGVANAAVETLPEQQRRMSQFYSRSRGQRAGFGQVFAWM
jgi:hypothetical protein